MNEYIVMFTVFGLCGWIWESIYCTICDKKWANRGFLYGPVCPIYGFGGIIGLALYDLQQAGLIPSISVWQIFIAGFAVSIILEYPTSVILEKLFHARWWDYSEIPLNINGRTSIPTSIAFGGASILVLYYLIPFCDGVIERFPQWVTNLTAIMSIAVITCDLTLTVSALTDFQSRVAAVDDKLQHQMTDFVDQLYTGQHNFKRKAVERIAVFRLSNDRLRIAKGILEEKFDELIEDYRKSPIVNQMSKFIQHGETTTLEHCENVAWVSFLINEKLHLNADEKKLVEIAMLHDMYLYDWHDGNPLRKTHGFDHPNIASENAVKYFDIPKEEQDAIKSHMWPLTITQIPKNREAVILCIADKYCAVIETLRITKNQERK